MDARAFPEGIISELDRMVGFVGDGCFVVGSDGLIVAANDRALRDYGYSREGLIGMQARLLCPPESEWLFEQALQRWADSGELFDIEQQRADGKRFTAEFRAATCPLEGCDGIVLTVREVTELRECQEELELKSLMLEGSMDAIVVHRIDGELVYFNHAAAVLLGMTVDEFALIGNYGWMSEEMRATRHERIAVLHECGELRFESVWTHKNGGAIYTEVHARLVETLQGELVISITRDVTERLRAQEHIAHLAYHDSLTGLPNRALLEQRLTSATKAAARHGDLVGVVFVDLDNFKPINDTYGHAVGDAVLQVLAERMGMCLREYDTVARLGGDEFIVLLPRLTRREDLAVIAFKVARGICEEIEICGHRVEVSGSVGLAIYEPGEPLDALIQRADAEMYRAKQQSLPGWEVFLGESCGEETATV